jgi:hypothetical protein
VPLKAHRKGASRTEGREASIQAMRDSAAGVGFPLTETRRLEVS